MSSRTLRRRLHHGDVDGKRQEHLEASGLDGLSEPLLGGDDYIENKKVRNFGNLHFFLTVFHFVMLIFLCHRYVHLKIFGMTRGRRRSFTGHFYFQTS